MFAQLLPPIVCDALTKSRQPTAFRQLGYKFLAVLPFLQCLDLFDLASLLIFTHVEKGWCIDCLPQEGHLILLLKLE